MLAYTLLLAMAITLMLFGLQDFFNPKIRGTATGSIRATLCMVAGAFLFYFWYMAVTSSSTGSSPSNSGQQAVLNALLARH